MVLPPSSDLSSLDSPSENDRMNALFDVTAYAVEEAIINSMVAAETMTGIDGHKVVALPHDRLRSILKNYNRLVK